MFKLINGNERYKVTDLVTKTESSTDDKLEAYRYCAFLLYLGHDVRFEEYSRGSKRIGMWSSKLKRKYE